jgi:Kef-type K+ transport system membrane component KefB
VGAEIATSTTGSSGNGAKVYIAIAVSVFAVILITLGLYLLWRRYRSKATVQRLR